MDLKNLKDFLTPHELVELHIYNNKSSVLDAVKRNKTPKYVKYGKSTFFYKNDILDLICEKVKHPHYNYVINNKKELYMLKMDKMNDDMVSDDLVSLGLFNDIGTVSNHLNKKANRKSGARYIYNKDIVKEFINENTFPKEILNHNIKETSLFNNVNDTKINNTQDNVYYKKDVIDILNKYICDINKCLFEIAKNLSLKIYNSQLCE